MADQAQDGNTVTIRYTGKLSDGSVFDSTEDREPFEFVVGAEDILPGISIGVVGMREGETRTIDIPPDDAYGPRDPEKLVTVEASRMPEGVAAGDLVTDGENRRWLVHKIEDGQAVIDANHPLAGQTLHFDVELVSIR
jgi:peptidylprolyl isomerase